MNNIDKNVLDAFNGIIAEFQTWFDKGTPAEQECLIIALRHCADMIDEDMPTIEE